MDLQNQIDLKTFPSYYHQYRETYQRQRFSIPDSIIYYIAKNPSNLEVYQKLIQSCKYFFIKNSVLVVPFLMYENDQWKICHDAVQNGEKEIVKYLGFFNNNKICCSLWVANQLQLRIHSTSSSTIVSELIPKLYKCDAKHLDLKDQIFSINEFLLFSKSAQGCFLKNVTVNSQNGGEIPFEMVIANLPSLRTGFKCEFGSNSVSVSSKTAKELIKIPHFTNIQIFTMVQVSKAFDIDIFYDFLKRNKMTAAVAYKSPLSDSFKSKLETMITEILRTETFDYNPPFIVFEGQNRLNRSKLCKLYEKF